MFSYVNIVLFLCKMYERVAAFRSKEWKAKCVPHTIWTERRWLASVAHYITNGGWWRLTFFRLPRYDHSIILPLAIYTLAVQWKSLVSRWLSSGEQKNLLAGAPAFQKNAFPPRNFLPEIWCYTRLSRSSSIKTCPDCPIPWGKIPIGFLFCLRLSVGFSDSTLVIK